MTLTFKSSIYYSRQKNCCQFWQCEQTSPGCFVNIYALKGSLEYVGAHIDSDISATVISCSVYLHAFELSDLCL